MSKRFATVVGVDIAPTMVELARSFAADRPNIDFIVNDRADLAVLDSSSVDLVYSNIVLQHMDQALARGYLHEFYRVVRPNGFVVFQIPSHLTDEWLPFGNDGTVLPDGTHSARLIVVEAPGRLIAGATATIGVHVENASEHEWLQDLTNQLNLANHWVRTDGSHLVHDDARARLPSRMRPGESAVLELLVTAPDRPGSYDLQVDIVQEHVNWFADTRLGDRVGPHRDRAGPVC